ncbi:MAG: class I SAM-dependent methyltransferase [Bacillota bacterium]
MIKNMMIFLTYMVVSSYGLYKLKTSEFIDMNFITGTFFYGLGFLIWFLILKLFPLSVAFPIASGLLIISTQFVGIWFLSEKTNIYQISGVILIIIGIFLINFKVGNTMGKVEQQGEHFESISDKYYQSRQAENHLLLKKLIWADFFKDKEYLKKENMAVLEPMCGYAEGKKILESHLDIKFDYFGFDYSENLINQVKKQDSMINVVKMDVTKFKPEKQYDLIILIGGLHHVPAYTNQVIDNISKALKDGGFFINFEPSQNNFLLKKIRDRIYEKNSLFDNDTEKAFDLDDLNRLYTSNKLKIVDQFYPGLLSYVLYYNPDAFPALNIGNKNCVKIAFNLDKLFIRNIVGKKLSFATLTLLQKV